MQEAKGPTEKVNHAGARKPPNSEKNWVKGHFSKRKSEKEWGQSLSSRQGKFDICQYCAGPSHPRSICPASNKRCSKKGCGRIGHFARAFRMGVPPLVNPSEVMNTKQQARHLDATRQDCEDYGTDLFEVDLIPVKYAQSVFSTAEDQRGTRVGRKFFTHLKLGLTKGMIKSIRIQMYTEEMASPTFKNPPIFGWEVSYKTWKK